MSSEFVIVAFFTGYYNPYYGNQGYGYGAPGGYPQHPQPNQGQPNVPYPTGQQPGFPQPPPGNTNPFL